MKTIIYTLKSSRPYSGATFKRMGEIYCDADKWGKITEDSFKAYAKKTNSDLKVFGPSTAELPDFLGQFQRITWAKFEIFEHFLESKYDKMLYLDLDVYIKRRAPNIFEELTEPGFNMSLDGSPMHKEFMSKLLKTDICHNAGVICVDRPTLEEFYKNVPAKNEWKSFLKEKGISKHDETNEQVVISSIIQEHNINVNLFNSVIWNVPWSRQREDSNFVHYYGVDGKLILYQLSRLNKGINIQL